LRPRTDSSSAISSDRTQLPDDADEEIRGGQERSEHKALVRRQVLPRCSVLSRGLVHRERGTARGYTTLV
jgi:hypothetical protein